MEEQIKYSEQTLKTLEEKNKIEMEIPEIPEIYIPVEFTQKLPTEKSD